MNKITVVLVLYQKKISRLPIFKLLKEIEDCSLFSILIYDNSLEKQQFPFENPNFYYFHDPSNPGLATAYNYAWKLAEKNGSDALLLLDDDTRITKDYLSLLMRIKLDKKVGAVIPIIYSGKQQISPVFADKYINKKSLFPTYGLTQKRIMAINSGTLIPIVTLAQIKGFNEVFSLDFLDHWFFWRLYQEKLSIKILNVQLHHDLSVLDYRNVSLDRYKSILFAENLFYSKYETNLEHEHKKQLVKRTFKQFFRVRNRKIWRLTLSEFLKK